MRNFLFIIFSTAIVLFTSCDNTPKKTDLANLKFEGIEDSLSYILGMSISQQYDYYNQDDYRPEFLGLAMKDFIDGNEFRINEDQRKDILTHYFRWAKEYKNDSLLRESTRFLKANGKKEGVEIRERGLQRKVLVEGDPNGSSPDGNDVVQIRYTQGSNLRGQLWDQTMATNKRDTIEMAINRELSGFSQALQHMKEGEKSMFWLPPKIGSAEGRDPAGVAMKNEVIWMEIELLRVKPRSTSSLTEGELKQYPGYFLDESKRDL